MALSGTFAADFSAFVKESEKATVALKDMEAQGVKVERSVNTSFTNMTAGATKVSTATTTMGTQSTNAFTSMARELRVADQSMSAFGVNMNPVVHVMDELGQASGKSVGELGKLGTASAVAAAAFAGWNLGRWIADITGADAAIANLTSRLLGWGDVAAQTAGAKQDVLNLATQRAGRVVTDYSEALQINADWLKKHREAAETANKAVAAATKEKAAADEKAAAAAQAHSDAMQRLQDSLFGYDLIAKAQDYLEALVSIENVTQMSTAAQAQMHATLGEAIDAYARLGVVAPQAMRDIYTATLPLPKITEGLGAEWANVGEKVTVSADSIIADLKRMEDETKAYEAETRRMVDEWNQVKPPVDQATQAIDQQTAAVGRLSVQMVDLGRVNQSVWESLVAGHQLMEAYREAGVATGMQIATGGYTFQQQRAGGVIPTSGAVGNTLNVNVNNADAQGIASKLVTEMRHQGVRF